MTTTTKTPLPSFDTPPKDVRELADRVVGLLRQGWCQGQYAIDGVGAVESQSLSATACCVAGALSRADAPGFPTSSLTALKVELCRMVGDVAKWNDAPGRTVDQVIELVQRAAGNIGEGER